MVQGLIGVELLLAELHVDDGLLVHFGDGLGYSSDLGGDEEGLFESHGLVGYFHLVVFDGEFYFWGN